MISSVIIRTCEHEPSVYVLRDGVVVLAEGRDIGPVDLAPADADLVGLVPGIYRPAQGAAYLRALWATYFRGSRLRAERIGF